MKIALIGYGKMGKAIEEIAVQHGHEIVLKIDIGNLHEFTQERLENADVAIEFSSPHSAFDNVMKCLQYETPVICGSTGWLDRLDEVKAYCNSHPGAAFLYSSNYSIGVNIFFELNRKLASMMAEHPFYDVSMAEIHHTQKKDAPSGTAISLAEQIIDQVKRKKLWVNHISDNPDELEIISERIDITPGTHSVKYSSLVDNIEIIHTAHSRMGFANGAVLAAEFINGKNGIFSMKDVLGF